MYTTIRIQTEIGTGTGFIYDFKYLLANQNSLNALPCIVTNKHVIEGATTAHLVFRRNDGQGNVIPQTHHTITVALNEANIIPHPEEDVDLCIIPLAPFMHQAREEGVEIHWTKITKDSIPSQEQVMNLNAVEDILMVGYPNGIYDSLNNLPIMRKGITASHLAFDYNGKSEFLIDAACFPGSSGSPVFLLNEGTFSEGNTINVGHRMYFLGILYAGPMFTQSGHILPQTIPTSNEHSNNNLFHLNLMMNLGVIIKSHRLNDFEPILNQLIQSES